MSLAAADEGEESVAAEPASVPTLLLAEDGTQKKQKSQQKGANRKALPLVFSFFLVAVWGRSVFFRSTRSVRGERARLGS